MTPSEIVMAAYRQQNIAGRKDADVSIFVRGAWNDKGKRLLGRKGGPLGQCMAEYEDGCLCLFKADELIAYAAKFLPTIKASDLIAATGKKE